MRAPALLVLAAGVLPACAGAPPPAAPGACVHPPPAPAAAPPKVDVQRFPWWPEGLAPAEAPVYVNNDAVVDAPPAVVWSWLTRADRWATWFPRAKNVHFEAGGPTLDVGTVVVWEMLNATIRACSAPGRRAMAITSTDTVPLSQAGARLADLAEEVREGSEKILTRDGDGYVALVDARKLEHYHLLEQEHIHLTLLSEASLGLDDVKTGQVSSVDDLRAKYRR
jgi:hypothetical protein